MSSHAPHKRQRCSHAVAARSSVPERTAVQRESTFADHELDRDQNEEEGEVRNEASNDINNVTAARQQALRQAEAEGFVLQPSDNAAGFKGVSFHTGTSKPYEAKVRRGGKVVSLGTFATAEEAALCYARDIAANGAPPISNVDKAAAAPAPLTAEEVLRQAETEGLTLQPSDNSSGFKGVSFRHRTSKSYQAMVKRGGKVVSLGNFATAEEAALCYARDIAVNGAPGLSASEAAKVAAAALTSLTAEEVLRQAESEGLTLQPSDNSAGFKAVSLQHGSNRSKPYRAEMWRGGKTVILGSFATAEEAALCYARHVTVNGAPGLSASEASKVAAAALTSLTAEEALRQAEAEGLVLQPSDNAAGFKGVSFHTGTSKPYEAKVRRGGKVVSLGGFATAEEAALCYARDNAATGGATLSAPAANKARAAPPPLVTEEARRHEAESVGVDVQGMPTVPAGLVERPGLVADLCKIIERQSSEIAELRRTLAQATGQSSVV